ncbi:MAG: hypothetical protein QOG67_1532 [Verrucomicrobiota bacterium]
MKSILVFVSLFFAASAGAQTSENIPAEASKQIPLVVEPGVPLRVYLTKRLPKRLDEPVQAKLVEPLYAFDREVAPAGSQVIGKVSRLEPVSKMKRTTAIFGGDFTPLHRAEVEFTTLVLPDGRQISLHTHETSGLNSIFVFNPPKKNQKQNPGPNGGILGTAKQQARDRINAAVNSKTRGVADLVRGPDKMERVEEFLLMKLPYHPQWVRKGTRFDPELSESLQFGTVAVKNEALALLGSQPPPDSIVHARLLTPLNSGSATQGEKVEAIVSQPLFSADRKLILPEGTRLTGAVASVHAARWFHRGGQLQFNFQKIDLPQGVTRPMLPAEAPALKIQATLAAAEAGGNGSIKVDEEGGVKATEPKTRLIAPLISILIAGRSSDNDGDRIGKAHDSNVGGRTLGGGSGFGLLGAAAAQSSPIVGTALGYYGAAWSVYSNIIARGAEVEFGKNAAMDIRFGGRKSLPASKFRSQSAHATSTAGY